MENNLLILILIIPTLAALLVVAIPFKSKNSIRWFAFGGSLIPFLLSLIVWFQFDKTQSGFQFETQLPWFSAIGSSFHFGVDGISMPMVLLSTLLTPLAILASYGIKDNVKAYMALFLFLETGVLGVFVALDLLVFFLFWEIGLIPMYFLISHWGGAKRNYASLKFILVTMAGITKFLEQKKLAVVGVSRSEKKFSNKLYKVLKSKGYQLSAVNPYTDRIDGEACFVNIQSLPQQVNGVVIVVPPNQTEQVVKDAVAAGIKHIWLQQGAESKGAIVLSKEGE